MTWHPLRNVHWSGHTTSTSATPPSPSIPAYCHISPDGETLSACYRPALFPFLHSKNATWRYRLWFYFFVYPCFWVHVFQQDLPGRSTELPDLKEQVVRKKTDWRTQLFVVWWVGVVIPHPEWWREDEAGMYSADGFTDVSHVEDIIVFILFIGNLLPPADPQLPPPKRILFLNRCSHAFQRSGTTDFHLNHLLLLIRIRFDELCWL